MENRNKLLLAVLSSLVISCSSSKGKILPEINFDRSSKQAEVSIERNSMPFSVFSNVVLKKLLVKKSFNIVLSYKDMKNYRIDVFSPGIPKLLFVLIKKDYQNYFYSINEKIKYFSSSDLLSYAGLDVEAKYIISMFANILPAEDKVKKVENVSSFYKVIASTRTDINTYAQYYFEKCASGKYKIHGLEVYDTSKELSLYSKSDYAISHCEEDHSKAIKFIESKNELYIEMKNFKYRDFKEDFLNFDIANFKTILIQ